MNLISGSLLIRELTFESNKVIINKNDNFIGRDYISNHVLKLNVTKVESNKIIPSFVQSIEFSNFWHGRFDHVNYNIVKRMMNLNLIPKYDINTNKKNKIYVQSKQLKKSFKIVHKKIKF